MDIFDGYYIVYEAHYCHVSDVVTTNFDDAFPSAAESPLAYLLQHARTYVPGTWGIDVGMR